MNPDLPGLDFEKKTKMVFCRKAFAKVLKKGKIEMEICLNVRLPYGILMFAIVPPPLALGMVGFRKFYGKSHYSAMEKTDRE